MLRSMLVTIIILTVLAGCGPAGGWPEEDLIVDRHGEIENLERLDGFIENFNQQKKDAVRIEHVTTEGDPIYETLRYSNNSGILLQYDASEDAYGSGEEWERTCEKLEKKESEEAISYIVDGCSGSPAYTLIEIQLMPDGEKS